MELYDIFETIDVSNHQNAEFPLDFLTGKNDSVAIVKHPDGARIYKNKSFVIVPTFTKQIEDLKKNAGKLLVVAASENNIVVYDEQAKQGELTTRLLNLIITEHRRNLGASTLGRITDIFIPTSASIVDEHIVFADTRNIKLHLIEEVSNLTDYFIKKLHCTLPKGCTNLVIGVDKRTSSFVIVRRKDEYGQSVLDSKSVLLGAY
jgi:hypothetical protein